MARMMQASALLPLWPFPIWNPAQLVCSMRAKSPPATYWSTDPFYRATPPCMWGTVKQWRTASLVIPPRGKTCAGVLPGTTRSSAPANFQCPETYGDTMRARVCACLSAFLRRFPGHVIRPPKPREADSAFALCPRPRYITSARALQTSRSAPYIHPLLLSSHPQATATKRQPCC